MNQLQDYFLQNKKLPLKPVVLTFDDGYKDNFTTALPLLQKYGHVGNVFSISDWIGKENKWEDFGKELTTTMNKSELIACPPPEAKKISCLPLFCNSFTAVNT